MVEAARLVFADEIDRLEQHLLRMASIVEQMLYKSMEALANRDVSLANEVISMDDAVDSYNIQIENECLRLLALQQPMARDLRVIAATMKIITDIERMGDYVVDIAKTAKQLSTKPLFKPLIGIPYMAELVKKMLRETLQAFINRDMELVEHMIAHDDEVDNLNRSLYKELIGHMQSDPTVTEQAVSLILIARYLERLADHVTNVGERVYYMETGEMKEFHK
jgi:phosphate transport system protein